MTPRCSRAAGKRTSRGSSPKPRRQACPRAKYAAHSSDGAFVTLSLSFALKTCAPRSLPKAATRADGHGQGHGQDFYARGGLEIKVCVRTYRLFYVSRTEDVLWRVQAAAER